MVPKSTQKQIQFLCLVVIEQEWGYNLIKKAGLFDKNYRFFFFYIFLILYTCKRAQGQLQRSSPVAIQFILPEAEIILTLILLLITFLKKCCNLFSYNNYKLSTDIEYFFVPSWTEKCTLVILGHTRSNKMGPQLPPIYIGSGPQVTSNEEDSSNFYHEWKILWGSNVLLIGSGGKHQFWLHITHGRPMPDKKIEDGAKIAACDHLYYCKYALC